MFGWSATCHPCPTNLEFSPQCQQCLHSRYDQCTNDVTSTSAPPYCPDICYLKGPGFTGTMVDPNDESLKITCNKGVTEKCNRCPNLCQYLPTRDVGKRRTLEVRLLANPGFPRQMIYCAIISGRINFRGCYDCPVGEVFNPSNEVCVPEN